MTEDSESVVKEDKEDVKTSSTTSRVKSSSATKSSTNSIQYSESVVKEDKEDVKTSSTTSRVKSSSATKSSTNSTSIVKKDKTREAPQTRVVIRHLPPTMTSDEFLDAISPVPEHNDYYFCKSDQSLGVYGFCRSYINFIHMEDVFIFKDKFDGYVFIDIKGNEFPAIVEFAPYQRNIRRRFGANGQTIANKRRDNKSGTIEQDSDYLEFLEELTQMKNESNMPSAEVYLEEIEARDKQLRANHGVLKMSTPLLEFLKNKKIEKNRLREERREERRIKQLEQKRLKEEEQQKKTKLLRKDDNKRRDFSDENREKSVKKEDERMRIKTRDSDKSRNESKGSEYVKRSEKPAPKGRHRNRSDKFKDNKDGNTSKDNDSTFVVKVVNNSNAEKKHESNASQSSDAKMSDTNTDNRTQETKPPEESHEESKPKESKSQRPESSSNKSEGSKGSDSRRIRNKDRPSREIYKPGSTKRPAGEDSQSQSNSESHTSGRNKSSSNTNTGYKPRVYTRSKP
ncbi:unnamed protein product [Oppiella nova]|uniref:UPF3 domain-containing protein n=1 Tax=Oppiella nova TaxID=334625 RepID=A0A7R9QPW6_9ACAR|nr:unnamed protein product [Oppiella nova]CAG2169428.1 unnamed protein product [Oppiella nova]